MRIKSQICLGIVIALIMMAAMSCSSDSSDGTNGEPDTQVSPSVDTQTPEQDQSSDDVAQTPDLQTEQDSGAPPLEEDITPPPTDPCEDPDALHQDALTNGHQILQGVTLDTVTPISDILANPPQFEGQLVQIEGFVKELCTSQGCWAKLQDFDGNALNLKVTDGNIDFRNETEPGVWMIGEGIFNQQGEHGLQVFIDDNGAMSGSIKCPLF